MGYSVVFTDTYHEELESTVRYQVKVSGSRSSADALLSALQDMINLLEVTPELKAISTKPALETAELREWFVKEHVVVYRFDGQVVYLEHLFHQRQNFAELL